MRKDPSQEERPVSHRAAVHKSAVPKPTVLCLAGPTASGKSATALALAEAAPSASPMEIIAVDSATLYRGMDVGTAKPTQAERTQIPHHLIDILDPAQSYSVADFVRDAESCIKDILARGNVPVLCGGTMMYFKALREGLADLPQADPATRAAITAQAAEKGWPALHAALMRVDPQTASRLAPNDSQRIQRALEIYRVSGMPMSHWLAQQSINSPFEYVTLSLEPINRAALHERIKQRFTDMMANGLLDEVRRLYQRGDLHPALPSIRCVGYRQLWAYLENAQPLEDAVGQAIAATRQLAKRQLTWLRSLPARIVVNSQATDAPQQILNHARRLWTMQG